MANHKQLKLHQIIFACLILSIVFFTGIECPAKQSWQAIDKQLQNNILQLNVGLKLKLQNKYWVQVAGLSLKENYYTFTTSESDKGYQVVGRGSAFILTVPGRDKRFIVTSNHVLDNAEQILAECQMFYAAAALYAQEKAPKDKQSFEKLLVILNLPNAHDISKEQRALCQNTVNAIWNCYDTYLSVLADPHRILFNRYQKLVPITASTDYFLHMPGVSRQKAIEATVYKRAKAKDADLAILIVDRSKLENSQGLELDLGKLKKDFAIQVAGYPAVTDKLSEREKKNLFPRYSDGKITNIKQPMIQFDALLTKGNSGGPLISDEGKVLGVVTARSMTKDGQIMPYSGGAVSAQTLQSFAPELFRR